MKFIPPQEPRLLRRSKMALYASGQQAEGILNAAFSTFLLFYYQQIIGVSGTLTGLALALALCADAITDPIAGNVSDRTRTRLGRRHPYMFVASIPLALFFVMLFNPPDALSQPGYFLWLLIFAILVRVSATFFQIPHLALGAELTTSTTGRAALYNMAALFRMAGEGLVPLFAYLLFFPTTQQFNPGTLNSSGYQWFSLFFAVWIVTVMVVSSLGTLSEIPQLIANKADPGKRWFSGYTELKEALYNRAFRSLFTFVFAFGLITAVTGVFAPYMAFHFWGLTTETLAMIVVLAAPGVLPTLFLAPWLTSRFDKRDILLGSSAAMLVITSWAVILRLLDISWFPENGTIWITAVILINTMLTAMVMPIFISSTDSMMADIADEIDLETGQRREGVLFAARAFIAKATASLGLLAGGILLDLIEFPRNASLGTVQIDTVWQLGFISGPAKSVLLFMALGLMLSYPLNRDRYRQIRAKLNARNNEAG